MPSTYLVIAVDNCSSDEVADREDQLSDEGGEKENELHQRIEEVKAGSNEDPSQTEERPQETPYPEHGKSMGCWRATWVAQVALAASDRRKDCNDHDRNDDREAALSACDLFVRFIVCGARVAGTPGALG